MTSKDKWIAMYSWLCETLSVRETNILHPIKENSQGYFINVQFGKCLVNSFKVPFQLQSEGGSLGSVGWSIPSPPPWVTWIIPSLS